LVVIAETEVDLIKRLNAWKDNMKNRAMRVNMNKTKVISGERQKLMQKAVRWPCSVCGTGNGSRLVQYNVLVVRSGYTRSLYVQSDEIIYL